MDNFNFMILNWYSDDRIGNDDDKKQYYKNKNLIENDDNSDDDDDDECKYYHIYLFGVNEHGKSVCLDVCYFTPFFYVKIDSNLTQYKIDKFVQQCKKSLYKNEKYLIQHKIVYRKDAYGFTNDEKFKFIRFDFNNIRAYHLMKWYIKNKLKNTNFKLYNSNIDPILTFMHIRDISASGWISIDNYHTNTISNCDINISTKWTNIKHCNKHDIPPLKILSFDIECYSHTDDFPLAKNDLDQIIQIGSSVKRFGQDEVKQTVVVLGECKSVDNVNIISVSTEKDLLTTWFDYLRKENPDLIIGYNIDGFDWEYINIRCEKLNCSYKYYSRLYHVPSHYKSDNMESKAYGMNVFNHITTPGINQIDLLHYFRKETKLDRYTLDFVAKHFLGEEKRPVSPREIFSMGGPNGTPLSRSTVADYCAQDTLLPLRLLENRCIVPNLIEMSKCVSVPLTWLITRGQQIKVYSQVQRELRKNNYVFPEELSYNDNDQSKYEGATVLNCERGLHMDHPTAGLDFKSLYPSIIIAHNICITTLILNDKYKTNTEVKRFKWENGDYLFSTKPGIIPKIIDRLWKERDRIKMEMKQCKDKNMKAILNAKQLAIKTSMNSIYGVFGSNVGYICMKPLAATVTYIGRSMIAHSKKCAETFYNGVDDGIKATVIYGDSVTGDMPIMINDRNKFVYPRRIDSFNQSEWYKYGQNKEQASVPNVSIYSINGWVKPLRVVRHRVKKKLYRVITQKGIVIVTEDHSLLDKHTCDEIKPTDLKPGDELVHRFIMKKKVNNNTTNTLKEKQDLYYHKVHKS